MATGLDTAAGIAGLASICVTLLQGCIKGISVIAAARQMGRRVERLSLMLELEQFRLLRWGERAGLCDNTDPAINLNWPLVHELLEQLLDNLTDLKRLRERYNLVQSDEDDAASDATPSLRTASTDTQAAEQRKQRSFGKLWKHASSTVTKSRAEILQQKSTNFVKLRWVTFDEDKTRQLLSDVTYLNNALQDLLDISHQDVMKSSMELLVRDMVSRCTNMSDLDTMNAIIHSDAVSHSDALRDASRVKQTRILLGTDKKAEEIPSKHFERPKLTKVSYDKLSNIRSATGNGKLQVAEYKTSSSKKSVHSIVLLEWKSVDSNTEQKIEKRMMEFAVLLGAISDASFHSLRCLGFLKRIQSGKDTMLAYVFELVNLQAIPTPSKTSSPISLRDALLHQRRPSLTERLRMCLALAENVLQLHTAGWLHKGICADTILFIATAADGWELGKYAGPFVAGYEFARNTLEETEAMPFDEGQLLYKHHTLLEADDKFGGSFRKIYDLHALGCVLLEITTWTPLEDILLSSVSTSRSQETSSWNDSSTTVASQNQLAHKNRQARLQLKSSLKTPSTAKRILEKVAFAAGDSCVRAIELCLFPSIDLVRSTRSAGNADFKEGGDDDDEEDEDEDAFFEVSVEVQTLVVNVLRSVCSSV